MCFGGGWYLQKLEEDFSSSGTGVIRCLWVSWHGCWELKLDSLEEQYVLLKLNILSNLSVLIVISLMSWAVIYIY